MLNNECSAEFKEAIRDNHMTYELVLPDDHQKNIAEREIYTEQTGRFSERSDRSHQYTMVLINMYSSYISMEPMKTRHTSQLVKT